MNTIPAKYTKHKTRLLAVPDAILELHWLAAWLEGEGHFRFKGSPQVRGYTTDRDVARRAWSILSTLFGPASLRENQHGSERRKRCYEVAGYGATAVQCLLAIYALMGSRRQKQIRTALSPWRLRRT
jgi:hypothetical protein